MERERTGQAWTRRRLIGAGVAGAAAATSAACGTERIKENELIQGDQERGSGRAAREGRLLARPGQVTGTVRPGEHRLGLGDRRDGLLYVPKGYRADRPAPFVLLLHGAGGSASGGLSPLRQLADASGLVLLAPDSRGKTWDVLLGGFGPDVAYIERALAQTFARCAIDPKRLAVGGFSDGASYALSVGITNGDLFSHIVAFAPGFMAPAAQEGKPRIYIAHGTQDRVLPIDRCSRTIVPRLQRARYDVRYREFDGPHTVPPEIAREAVEWFVPKAA